MRCIGEKIYSGRILEPCSKADAASIYAKTRCALILLSIRTYDKHAYVELNFSEKIINKMYLGSKA